MEVQGGPNFTGDDPYTVTVWLGGSFDTAQLGCTNQSTGTIYVNGIPSARWSACDTDLGEWSAEVQVLIHSGRNSIQAVSDNGRCEAGTTVYLFTPGLVYYKLTLNVDDPNKGSTTVEPPGDFYESGSTVAITAVPTTEFAFTRWIGDVPESNATDNPLQMIMDSDKSLVATFAPLAILTLDVVEPGWGRILVEPNLTRYEPNSSVWLTAEPNQYRIFSHWQGDVPDGNSTDNPVLIRMEGNRHVTAIFTWPSYLLTLGTVNAPGTINVEPYAPNYVYPAGTELILNAVPAQGKYFDEWRIYDPNYPDDGNHAVSDSNNPIMIVMDADRTVVAVFKCSSDIGPMLPLMGVSLGGLALLRRRR